MIFFALTVFLIVLPTGYLQEIYNENTFNVPQNVGGPVPMLEDQPWPMQTIHTVQGKFFGQALRNINSKPCSGRRNLKVLDEQWVPTFGSKIMTPVTNFDNTNLKQQENNDDTLYLKPQKNKEGTNNAKAYIPVARLSNEENVVLSDLNRNENNLYKTRNSLAVDNLVDDTVEDVAQIYLPVSEDNLTITEDRTGVKDVISEEDNSAVEANDTSEEYSEKAVLGENLDSVSINLQNVEAKIIPVNKLTDQCNTKKENTQDINHAMDESRRSYKQMSFPGDSINVENENIPEQNKNEVNLVNNNFPKGKSSQYEQTSNNEHLNPTLNNMRKANSMKFNPDKTLSLQSDDFKADMLEPTKGAGISDLTESRMLMDHSRLCYACSTASNPTCSAPDRTTTLKYCRKGHEACVTKTFQTGNTETLVRDCGTSCEDVDLPGFVPKYKSCSVCHTDLCNNAFSINKHNVFFAFLLIIFIKSMS